jgi:hypothetical protein
MDDRELVREEERKAAAEAAEIGGRRPPWTDEAQQPLTEAGQGQAEGFEESERELIERASHGDEHAARRVVRDAIDEEVGGSAAETAEADRERSSETADGSW